MNILKLEKSTSSFLYLKNFYAMSSSKAISTNFLINIMNPSIVPISPPTYEKNLSILVKDLLYVFLIPDFVKKKLANLFEALTIS